MALTIFFHSFGMDTAEDSTLSTHEAETVVNLVQEETEPAIKLTTESVKAVNQPASRSPEKTV